jgi:propanol-preferring alcohol dehydrogenase
MVLRETGPVHESSLEWTELPLPTPGPGEIRLRVSACAVCRTDLHVIEADLEPPALPLVPGHQVVGTVDSCGEGCQRFRGGERVGVAWLRGTCGICDACCRGTENLCESSRYTGYHDDGGYAEYAVVREEFAYPLPDAFDDLQVAPLLCAGIIGYRALTRAALPDGGRLGLFGFGSSAHVVLQIARHRGAEVYVATRGESHRKLADRLGADWVGETYDPVPRPLDSAIVFAPAGEVVPAALRALRKGGTVALAGIHMSPVPAMDYEPHLFHEKTLTSVEANTRVDGRALLEIATAIPIRPEVTAFPLRQANDALVRLKRDRVDGTAVLVP